MSANLGLRDVPAVIRRESASARFPLNYLAAKAALDVCLSIDECKEWIDLAAQAASYYKQAKDRHLLDVALRIQLRAKSRLGEVLLEVPAWKNAAISLGGRVGTMPNPTSRQSIGKRAGLSPHEIHNAVSIAKVNRALRERLIEASPPISSHQLIRMGERTTELRRRSARGSEYRTLMNDSHGCLGKFWGWASKVSPQIGRRLSPDEAVIVKRALRGAIEWLDELDRQIPPSKEAV